MPELPEVTTVIGILKNEVCGKNIDAIDVLYNKTIKTNEEEFVSSLTNKTIKNITRLGKYIIFHLSSDFILISHLRMEGKYSILAENEDLPPHSCVVFHLNSGEKMVYHDTRKFGAMYLSTEKTHLNELPLSKVGPEPMDLTSKEARKSIYKKLNKNKKIKELLLDQTIMSGIGNIYADEILFVSKVNPFTHGNELNEEKYDEIIDNSIKILERAIELGGSTIKSYHPKDGVDGLFQIELKAYGRKGEPCPNCGTKFKKVFLSGRGTTFCPNCQIDKNMQKAIAISGSIGAGKSTVLKILKDLGYFTASSDEIVAEIYTREDIKKVLFKKFGPKVLNENNTVNKQFLRDLISNDIKSQTFLEDLIFPEVEKEIINIIEHHENPIIEVPLLEKANLQYLFKKVIYVDADRDLRIQRIAASRPYDAETAVALFEKNNAKTLQNSIIFYNNCKTLRQLKNEIIKNLVRKF